MDWNTIIANVIIGIVVFVGFFIFYGKSQGWFLKGGLVYEYFREKRKSKKKKNDDDDF